MHTLERDYKKILSNMVSDDKSYILYPFGEGGRMVKKILNYDLKIKEKIVVDNGLYHEGASYKKLDEIKQPNNYKWIITCISEKSHDSIMKSIDGIVSEENCIDLYLLSQSLDKKYSKEKFMLLSKMDSSINNIACSEFVDLIKEKKDERRKISIAEIGCGVGATAVEACLLLDENDKYYCFDFNEIINPLVIDLGNIPEIKCEIKPYGNTSKIFDSYNWNLSELIYKMRDDNLDGIFDVVYLDGAHNFEYDGLACCLLKQLTKVGGYIVFDDVKWTFGNSITRNPVERPNIETLYDDKQIHDCQVQRVLNMFMISDIDWCKVSVGNVNNYRAIYKRIR